MLKLSLPAGAVDSSPQTVKLHSVSVTGARPSPSFRTRGPRITEDLGWHADYDVKQIVESAWSAWQAGPRRIEVPQK